MRGKTLRAIVMGLAVVPVSVVPASAQLGTCAVPVGPLRPDLIMDVQLLKSQMFVSEEHFNSKDCAVFEGVARPGKQLVLRFNSSMANVGDTDLHIGNPGECLEHLFHVSPCHQHAHFEEFTDYRLWTEAGYDNWVALRDVAAPTNSGFNAELLAAAIASGDLIAGRKQSFCMVDSAPYSDSPPGPAKYLSCSSNQGISVGWEDIYPPQLPDQFIQVTGLKEGNYVLENHVNPSQLLPEKDYANNFGTVRIRFTPKHGKIDASVQVLD